jgi:hypothetical protein
MSKLPSKRVHIAIGGLAGSALAKVLSPLVVADDNLLVGPSRVDVERHGGARTRYWGSAPSLDIDRVLVDGSVNAVVVALSGTLNSLLTLCRICSAALERGREVYVLDLGEEASVSPLNGSDPAREVPFHARRLARRVLTSVRWSRLETALAAGLWRLWCRRSPVAFSRFCAAASDLHLQLANLRRYHAGFFPRITDRGLSLSRLDELILRQLSHEWLTPAALYARALGGAPQLGSWLSHTGDLFLAARLLAWSRHTQGTIVERRKEHPQSDSKMLAWSFRWREGGEAILDALPDVQAAPPIAIGGAIAYGPERPWVCRFDGGGVPYVTRSAPRPAATTT